MSPSTPTKAQKAKSKSKKSPSIKPTAANLIKTRDAALRDFGQAKNTTSSYSGYIRRGRKFLAALVADRRASQIMDGLDNDIFAKAFSDTPNMLTVVALGFYITHKCFTQKRKSTTAYGIQSAFAKLYDQQRVTNLCFIYNHSLTSISSTGRMVNMVASTITVRQLTQFEATQLVLSRSSNSFERRVICRRIAFETMQTQSLSRLYVKP